MKHSMPLRMLVSHSTRDTHVRDLWQFIDELQTALDEADVPIRLVVVVSECGSMQIPMLSERLVEATTATDLTMMVLTPGYVDSNWCDDEMQERAQRSCADCPSHRLFPLKWHDYPWDHLWSREVAGWGVDLQDLTTDEFFNSVEENLWNPTRRPPQWYEAIARAVESLSAYVAEVRETCTRDSCPPWVSADVPLPSRMD